MSSEKTSVQVAVRIRPITNEDLINLPTRFQRSVLSTAPYAPNQVIVAGEKKQYFSYDHVFGPDSTQKDIYDKAVLKLIDKFLEGYNVTILAYGQTSSGKTFTMGTSDNESIEPDDKGIIPRAISTLFTSMSSAQYKTRRFSIKVSFIEIYNEDLIDLLGEGEGESRPQVLIREDSKGNILWSGLQEIKVNSVEEVMIHLARGSLNRQTGATDMNSKSSRSHAIFSVTLAQQKFVPTPGSNPSPQPLNDPQQKSGVRPPSRSNSRLSRRFDEGEWISVTSKFHFVDLAGSERLKRTSAIGDRVKEGISINSGLLALGNVISALGDPNKAKHTTHIPYRDSKLTRLLQDSLGGNAQTLMIACVSPAEYNLTETVNTLKYANRARNIKNIATINAEEAGWNDLEHLQTLVMKLRHEIKVLKAANGIVNSNGSSTNGTSSGRTTPSVNGRETPSYSKRPSTPSSLSNIPIVSQNGRETPSHLRHPSISSYSSNIPTVSHQQKLQNNKDIESLEEQLQLLKRSYSKLSQRYAKTSAELAKHQDNNEINNNGITNGDRNSLSVIKEVDDEISSDNIQFQEFVEPVIEEYEKSFTSLESELAITKAALSHSEIVIQEQEEKLGFAEQNNEKNKNNIIELKSKIAKFTERESSMEHYIKDLENKLEILTSEQKKDQDIINEMKSQISQMKSHESNTENYIENLENKLLTTEQHVTKLSETITKLENRLQQRDIDYHTLEEKLSQAENDQDKTLLLDELDDREKRISILEQNVESLENELEELRKLNDHNYFFKSHDLSIEVNNNNNDPMIIVALESKFSELQKTHEKTLQEFEDIKSKYQSCLLEIHELQNQLTEAKLIHSETVKSTPTTPMSPQSPDFRLSLPPILNKSNNNNNNNNNNN
ncbi:P-loop containing nucleoside triphosphate hydrolase protein, partial [Glomus cerebriforme]